MRSACFQKPVSVFVGLGFPRDIESIWQAYQLVNDWPHGSAAQRASLVACRAALAGEGDVDAVRSQFEDFARHAGILADDALHLAAVRHADDWFHTN